MLLILQSWLDGVTRITEIDP